jgi:hypothetical protein
MNPIFIGKSWTLEIDYMGKNVQGFITDAVSAKTYEYSMDIEDGSFYFDAKNNVIPFYVRKKLFALMRKEAKRIKEVVLKQVGYYGDRSPWAEDFNALDD